MIARIETAANHGLHAFKVSIEVDVSHGLPQLNIVGLPDTAIKESKERVRSAIKNSGYPFPSEKITINLAPADIRKEGPAFDLPIALGILAASEVIPQDTLSKYIFLGELALDGSLRSFKGTLAIISELRESIFVFPQDNALEAQLADHATVYGVQNLTEVIQFLRGDRILAPAKNLEQNLFSQTSSELNFSEVKGQYYAKRAIEISVAGGHNLLMIGPPGSGKTMLAKRIPTIFPSLTKKEILEITKIHSVSGLLKPGEIITERTFRSPHHSISSTALVGGGSWPKPGEISLAHHGVLFLDEMTEFSREALEALRTPMEDGEVLISRTKAQFNYPCQFMLTAAINPCPCGYLSDPRKNCRCSLSQIQKYQSRISGPILDRIDLHIELQPVSFSMLQTNIPSESSETIRERVEKCRDIQRARFHEKPFKTNAMMKPRDIKMFATADAQGLKLLERVIKELHFSARAYFKVLRIARTIADLANENNILQEHIAEAVQYRSLDRQWG